MKNALILDRTDSGHQLGLVLSLVGLPMPDADILATLPWSYPSV